MIIWGSGGDDIDLGEVETKYCDTCGTSRTFDLILEYRYWGLYWIFNFLTMKQYMVLCEICKQGGEIEMEDVESGLGKAPIPFFARYGMVTLIILGVIGAAITAYIENQSDSL